MSRRTTEGEPPSPTVVGMAGGVAVGLVVTVVTTQWWWVGTFLVVGFVAGRLVAGRRPD